MQRKLACSRCGKGEFASVDDLETHIVAQHFCTIQKKSAFYKCLYPNCRLCFPTAETCFRHELDVHLNGSLASLTLKQLEQNGVQDRTAFFKRRHFVEKRLAIHDCLNQSVNVVVSVFSVPAEPNAERLKASRSMQRKFSCSKCGQCDFASLDNLEIHIARQHFSDVDVCYKCLYPKFSYSNCPVQFYTEIACLKHELDVHLKGESTTMTLTQIERRHFVTLRLAIHNCLNESINVTFSGHPELNRLGSPQASLSSSMVKDEPSISVPAAPSQKPKRSRKQNFADLEAEDIKSTQPQVLSSPSVIKDEPSLIDELTADIPGPSNYDDDLCLNYSEDELRIFLPGRPKKSNLTTAEKEAIIQAKIENKPRVVAKILTRGNDLDFVDFDDEPGLILPAESREGYRGRPKGRINLTTSEKESIVTAWNEGCTAEEIAEMFACGKQTVYIVLHRWEKNQRSERENVLEVESIFKSNKKILPETSSRPFIVKDEPVEEELTTSFLPSSNHNGLLTPSTTESIAKNNEKIQPDTSSRPFIVKDEPTEQLTTSFPASSVKDESSLIDELTSDIPGPSNHVDNLTRSNNQSIVKNSEKIQPMISSRPFIVKDEPIFIEELASTIPVTSNYSDNLTFESAVTNPEPKRPRMEISPETSSKSSVVKDEPSLIDELAADIPVSSDRIDNVILGNSESTVLSPNSKFKNHNISDVNDDKRTKPKISSSLSVIKDEPSLIDELAADIPSTSNYDNDLCLNYPLDELRLFGRPKLSNLTIAEKEAIIKAKIENKPRVVKKILTRLQISSVVKEKPSLIDELAADIPVSSDRIDNVILGNSDIPGPSNRDNNLIGSNNELLPANAKKPRKQNLESLIDELVETIPISSYHSDYLTIENTESASAPLQPKRSRIYRSEGNKIRRRPGGGRKKCLTFPQMQAIIRASEQGKKKTDIAKMFHTSKHTVYRVLDAYTNERTAKGKSAYKENAYRSEESIDKNNETIEPDTSSEPSMIKEEPSLMDELATTVPGTSNSSDKLAVGNISTVIRKPGSGGKKWLTTQQMQAIVKANEQGMKKSDIAKMFDTSIPTVYRVLDTYRNEEPTASLPKPQKSRKQNFFDLNDDDGKRTEPQTASRSSVVKEESCFVHEFEPDIPGPSNYRHSNEQRASREGASSLRDSENLSSERTEHENAMNTKRGRPLAKCNGHLMTQEKKSADGLRQYWRCQMCHQGCPGRAISRTGSCDLTSTVAHDFHGSGPAVIKKRKVKYITPNPTTPSVRRDIIKASSEGLSLEQIAKKFDITAHSASLILNRWKVTSNGYIEVFAGGTTLDRR